MKTETKVELLKYIILKEGSTYDMMLYTLVRRKRLSEDISMIDERTLSFDVQAEDGTISAKQFLNILNEFVRYMKLYFYNIAPLSTCIDYVIDSKLELTNLLSYKGKIRSYFSKSDDPIFTELLNKLIISNFINNAKYVASIKDVLTSIGIPLKKVDEYSLDESHKILLLLSDIALCQRGRGPVMRLFDNMDSHLDGFSNMDLTRRRKTANDFKKQYMDSCIQDYDKLFKSYYSKNKYLKYFD